MEVLCFTLCYMEHQCCPLSLPFHIRLHQEYLISVLDRSTLETWHVSFSVQKRRGLFMVPSLHKVCPYFCSFPVPQGRHSVWLLCWLYRDVGNNTMLLLPCSCWISPHLDRSFWADLMFGLSLKLSKWNLSSIRGYSLRMCIPRGTGFVGCYCRLTSKLRRPQTPGPQW